jgi:hypothetical protein
VKNRQRSKAQAQQGRRGGELLTAGDTSLHAGYTLGTKKLKLKIKPL